MGKFNISINGKQVETPPKGETRVIVNGQTIKVHNDEEVIMNFGKSETSVEVKKKGEGK